MQSISCQDGGSRPVRRAIGAAAAVSACVVTLTLAADARVPYARPI